MTRWRWWKEIKIPCVSISTFTKFNVLKNIKTKVDQLLKWFVICDCDEPILLTVGFTLSIQIQWHFTPIWIFFPLQFFLSPPFIINTVYSSMSPSSPFYITVMVLWPLPPLPTYFYKYILIHRLSCQDQYHWIF